MDQLIGYDYLFYSDIEMIWWMSASEIFVGQVLLSLSKDSMVVQKINLISLGKCSFILP